MDIAWLESLGVRLHGVLAEHGLAVSYREALDLIAAVTDRPDWPAVMALPDAARFRYDDDGVERIVRRVASRHEGTDPDRLAFSLRHMSLFYRSQAATDVTQRLIIATDASGCGHLKRSRIADHVIVSHAFDSLVSGPVPSGQGPAAFFAAREAAYERDPLIIDQLWEWNRAVEALRYWNELLALCRLYARIELWIDPGPDEQLRAVQLLDWLGAHPEVVGKLHVVHADHPLGERGAEDIRTMKPTIERVSEAHLRTARAAWDAWRRPTPEAFVDLLADDLDALPYLRRAVSLLLGELPAPVTSLGATERLLLEVVAPGASGPRRFMHVNTQLNPSRVYGYYDEIRIMDRLCGCDRPLIDGLREPGFDLQTQDGRDRHRRYMKSELVLTGLGRAVLDGADDFARHNTVHRWWGGTLLTNADLWRWDASRQRLIAPA